MAPVGQREDVQRLHEAWKRHCDFPRHKLRSVYGGDAALLAEAIDEYGMANCLLVAKYAPDDGMVNGKHDDGKRHDSIRYIFGNNDAFNRILRAAHEREGKSNRRLSGIAAVEAARRL